MRMAHRTVRTALHAFVLLVVFFAINSVAAAALGVPVPHGAAKPASPHHSRAASGPHTLQSVHVLDVLALPVVQQPAGDEDYVSGLNDQTTQFSMAARFGTVGLLAHNDLSGSLFAKLAVGEIVRLVYADGQVEDFVITEILRYQALQPESTSSSFRDLATNQILSAAQVFSRVYTGQHHVTFQTCIANLGNLSWGRLFVIAMPVAL